MDDNKSSRLSKFNLLLIIIMAVILLTQETEQRVDYSISEYVDFSVTTIQHLSGGFMLGQAAQEKHLTGIKFTGRIINTQSVDHLNATFNLSVNGIDKEFTINKISSGNSTAFNVYIPDLSAESSRYAQIEPIGSIVRFRTK